MDMIQLILMHSIVIGGFLIMGIVAKVSAAASLRSSQVKPGHKRALSRMGLLVLVCLVFAGCGKSSDRLAIKGKVTLDGNPISAGSIILKPKEKGPQVGAKIKDGEYAFDKSDGPIPGLYRVEIYQDEAEPFPMDDPKAFAKQAEEDPSKLNPENKVPAEFNRLSTLTAQPEKNNQKIDFDLTTSK